MKRDQPKYFRWFLFQGFEPRRPEPIPVSDWDITTTS